MTRPPTPAGSSRTATARTAYPSSRRTVIALVASGLGVVPLKGLFSDWGWLVDVWLTMIVVIGPAIWLRRRRAPGALDIWPGIVLMIPWLTLLFVREHAIAGFVPGPGTWHDVSLLLVDLHHTTRDSVAPIHTTLAVRLVVCALLGLVAALVDLIAVVGRRGALAGVPLLVVYTVAGAVPRHPVSWLWFAFAAVAFMLLLGIDSEDVLASWGRRIRPTKAVRGTQALSVTTPRIAIGAVVIAIALPLLVPARASNLISNAFHASKSGGGAHGLSGFGGGEVGSISPFAVLRGQLVRPEPVSLMTVTMLGKSAIQPFYLRVNVLSDYTGRRWQVSDHGSTTQLGSDGYPGRPPASGTLFPTIPGDVGPSVALTARISLTNEVSGNAPVFAVPTSISGLANGTTWSSQDQLLLGHSITGRTDYTETFEQPDPDAAELQAAGDQIDDQAVARYLSLPADLPTYVTGLVSRLAGRSQTLYRRALAINDYFTDPANGFVYSLQTKAGDSGSELVDFLKNKQGYCQQYAAAEAVMFRAAGIPSRVVLGYMHTATDKSGSFTITTSDAHAWVEAYFPGQGWIPFDPTPSSGLAGSAKTDLPWAPHKDLSQTGQGQGDPKASGHSSSASHSVAPKSVAPSTTGPTSSAQSSGTSASWTALWWGLGVVGVLLVGCVPAAVRLRRRRSRLAAGRRGVADALWTELRDTAVDLGYGWSDSRTPRQVARWLTGTAGSAPESAAWLARIADAVEQQRYAAGGRPASADDLGAGLTAFTRTLRAGRSRSVRLRAIFAPPTVMPARRRSLTRIDSSPAANTARHA